MTITLNLPDDIAQQLRQREDADQIAALAISAALAVLPPQVSHIVPADTPSPEDLAAIAEAIAQEEAGLGTDGDAFFAELRAKRGWPTRSKDTQ